MRSYPILILAVGLPLSACDDPTATPDPSSPGTLVVSITTEGEDPDPDGYVLGIEPATNYPNPRSFEQQHGRVVNLRPGQKWRTEVTARWHQDAASISETEAALRAVQANRQPELLKQPKAEWASS